MKTNQTLIISTNYVKLMTKGVSLAYVKAANPRVSYYPKQCCGSGSGMIYMLGSGSIIITSGLDPDPKYVTVPT
jgi:hypothetical protein